MSVKYVRFFGGLIGLQEKWLNKMANKGYRLIKTTKATYEFEPCSPGAYQYKVEFVAHRSAQSAQEYANFLEDCGYKVFFKNMNLDYNAGLKVKGRLWADKGGKIATNWGAFNRELLIVEKANDGTPFQLHTTYDDQKAYYVNMRKPYLWLLVMIGIFGVLSPRWWWGVAFLVLLVILIVFQLKLHKLQKQSEIEESAEFGYEIKEK